MFSLSSGGQIFKNEDSNKLFIFQAYYEFQNGSYVILYQKDDYIDCGEIIKEFAGFNCLNTKKQNIPI